MIQPNQPNDQRDFAMEVDSFVEFEDHNTLDSIDKSKLPPKKYPKIVAPENDEPENGSNPT